MKLRLLAASILVLCTTLPSQAASVRLAWNPSPGRAVVGYMVHYGLRPGKYTHVVRVRGRLTTKVVIRGLKKGETYFFAVAAYNKKGEQSALSSEISGKPGGKMHKNHNKRPAVSSPTSHETSRTKIPPTRTLHMGPKRKILPIR